MKKTFLFLLLVISFSAISQTPTGYTKINARYKWLAGIFDSAFHAPQYNGVPSGLRGGSWTGSGLIGVDTSNHRLYFYSGGSWRYSTASTGGGLSVGGSNTQLQYNNSGAFGGITGATSNGADLFIPTLYGSSSANGDLVLEGTSHATKTTSYVNIQPSGGSVGIGISTPAKILHTVGTVRMASLGTASSDTTNNKPLGINSSGDVIPMTYWPGGGGSSSPSGNYGNLQINRNGAFSTPASDSLDWESATGLSVKGNIRGNAANDANTATLNHQVLAYSGSNNYYGFSLLYQNSRFRTALYGAQGADVGIGVMGTGATIPSDFTEIITVRGDNSRVGILEQNPTAKLHLPAGTASANTAPLKFTTGTNLTTAEAGAMEYDGSNFFLSPSTTRKRIPLFTNATPGNGEILIGNGTDFTKANITSSDNTITITNGSGTINLSAKPFVDTGTYTPTLTNTTNITSSTAYLTHWNRIGNQITVWGQVEVTTTATAATELRMSLPMTPSNFNNTYDAAGNASEGSETPGRLSTIRILAVTSNSVVKFIFDEQIAQSRTFSFMFTYQYVAP